MGAISSKSSPLHHKTPLIHSIPMSEELGIPVYLKMDALQPPGSFKLRGMGLACQRAKDRGAEKLVSSSGGNAGLAVAYAGKQLKLPTVVVVPETTPEFIRDRLRTYGAEVVVHGKVWAEANGKAIEIADATKGVLMHPYEGEDAWEGHGSLVQEIAEELETPPGAIIASVGGGGLVLGILEGLKAVGWLKTVPVIACETVGADCFSAAVNAGERVTLPGITSVAKSLGASQVSETLYERKQNEEIWGEMRSWVATDAAAVKACVRFANQHRVLVEPACGAALAAVYEKSPALEGCKSVVVEVCGGAIVDMPSLRKLADDCGVDLEA
ncbi:hypothetical protein CYMTET_53857 [Cymbomonas tetramitiformis]|uniref:L-serine ammonia-lyase n=1 Tax=Cymbomonas tetramitiformis TaxID=36881 RepID=A0AAE0BHX6_9CHLO|nr:hypothetical protein CYMTET_53857 [Cymbomonas tetramitiformis]